jgi:predicted hotdog family 3-hydroxylacyl-ACP dehydratase
VLDRHWIEAHIPHKGRMCLLDEVLSWDAAQICAASGTHRMAGHPLAAAGRLAAICGLEYAAQAMAVHCALLTDAASGPARVGYIASVRDVRLHVARLDDITTDLIAQAERLMGNERTATYELRLSSAGRLLVQGRTTVVMVDPGGSLAGAPA